MATTSDKAPIFIDTNILIRANVITAPFHRESLAALQKLEKDDRVIWISRQVLREYIATVTREQTFMKALPATIVKERVRYFEAHFQIADEQAQVTTHLLALLTAIELGGKQVHDANIVATMLTYNIKDLVTLNTVDFTRFSAYIKVLSLHDVISSP